MEAVAASVAALAAVIGAGADHADPAGAARADRHGADPLGDADHLLRAADPLRERADAALDGLAEVARLEARAAALKVTLASQYVQASRALAAPAASPHDRAVRAMAWSPRSPAS